jgi:hypothetical protein
MHGLLASLPRLIVATYGTKFNLIAIVLLAYHTNVDGISSPDDITSPNARI